MMPGARFAKAILLAVTVVIVFSLVAAAVVGPMST